MDNKQFNNLIRDAQGSEVTPLEPSDFDFEKYADYEASLLELNRDFWNSKSGLAVHRRFRVPEVFSYMCKDMKASLAWQLGALNKSMNFRSDIANFLEPWYGNGAVAAAFGVEYKWKTGQAPAIKAPFATVNEALEYDIVPVEETSIGKHILKMIEYFLEATKGKVPISLTDIQSPANTASLLIDSADFYMSFIDNPEGLSKLFSRITEILTSFIKKQIDMIGDVLVMPGHGFSSSRNFTGLGVSDDVIIMLSKEHYLNIEAPCLEKLGEPFGGAAFHSCGNWSDKINAVSQIRNLVMLDGAFSPETDPGYNPPEPFVEGFTKTGIIVNARIVGNIQIVTSKAEQLLKPGMKVIIVTYCKTPEEQEKVYRKLHALFD